MNSKGKIKGSAVGVVVVLLLAVGVGFYFYSGGTFSIVQQLPEGTYRIVGNQAIVNLYDCNTIESCTILVNTKAPAEVKAYINTISCATSPCTITLPYTPE